MAMGGTRTTVRMKAAIMPMKRVTPTIRMGMMSEITRVVNPMMVVMVVRAMARPVVR